MYKGVRWHEKGDRWEARIFDGNSQVSLGYYDTAEAAARVYDMHALRLRGPQQVAVLHNWEVMNALIYFAY